MQRRPIRWFLFVLAVDAMAAAVLLTSCTIPPLTYIPGSGGMVVTDGEATLFTKSKGQATQTDITVTAPNGNVARIKRLHITKDKDETVVPVAAGSMMVTGAAIKEAGTTSRAADTNFTTRELAKEETKRIPLKAAGEATVIDANAKAAAAAAEAAKK